MNLNTLTNNCSTILLPPNIHQKLTKAAYNTDDDKTATFWWAYFAYEWNAIGEVIRADLSKLASILKPIIYQYDVYTYLYKHKTIDKAYIDYLEHKYVLRHINGRKGKVYATFYEPLNNVSIHSNTINCIPNEIRLPFIDLPATNDAVKKYKEWVWLNLWLTMWGAIERLIVGK